MKLTMEKKLRMKPVAAFTALLICLILSMTAYANSAPVHITSGDTARGIIPREESPLIVDKELLTFDIPVLETEGFHYDITEAVDHSGTVTAQYFFKNPSADPVTLKLAFAHGIERINTSCDVRLNDTPLETQIRHTYIDDYESFFGPDDVKKIRDDYAEDDFFCPEMPVAEYIFEFTGIPDNSTADAVFTCTNADDTKTRIMLPCRFDPSGVYTRQIRNNHTLRVYVFGDIENAEISCCMKLSSGEEKAVLPKTGETMPLSDFAVMAMNSVADIGRIDSYNVVTDGLNASRHFDLIFSYLSEMSFYTTMWIEYEFTIGPDEEAVNTVKAVLAPEFFNYRRNPEFIYYYLLSPAQCWKKFGTLDVIINTPHSLYDAENEGYAATENGYIKHFDSLPDGELSFCLTEEKLTSAGEASEKPVGHGGAVFGVLLIAVLAIGGIVLGIGLIVIIVVIIVNCRKKKK